MKLLRLLFLCSLGSLVGWTWPFSGTYAPSNQASFGSDTWIRKQTQIIHSQIENLDPNVLSLSLHAYIHARKKGLDPKQLLTIIDYSKPSYEKRLFVYDFKNNKTLFKTWVAHGKNSGGFKTTSFFYNLCRFKL